MVWTRKTVLGEVDGRSKKAIDMTGQVCGRLTVIERAQHSEYVRSRGAAWICRCECGQVVEVYGRSLRRGDTSSCGCLRREMATKRLEGVHQMQREGRYLAQERRAIQEECAK